MLPENIGDLSQLEELFLGENQLTSLPVSFEKLQKLRSLDITHNNFTTFPESLKKLSTLRFLMLEQNQFDEEVLQEFFQTHPNVIRGDRVK